MPTLDSVAGSARQRRALFFMLGSAFSLSVMSAIVKGLGQRIPTAELLLARTLVSLVLSYAWLKAMGISPWGHDRVRLFFRGVLGFCGLACMFYALPRMPLAEATVIQYLYPVFTALLAAFFLAESLPRRYWKGTLLCLAGVLCVARPEFLGEWFGAANGSAVAGEHLPALPVWAALGAAWFSACAYVLVRRLSTTEHALVIVFYFPLVALPVTVPFVLLEFVMPRGWEWFWLLSIGVSTQLGQVGLTKGLQLLEASRSTAMAYSQVVFAATWGVVLFGEYPSALALLGTLAIVMGTWVIQRAPKAGKVFAN